MKNEMPEEIYAWPTQKNSQNFICNKSWSSKDEAADAGMTSSHYTRTDTLPRWNTDMDAAPIDINDIEIGSRVVFRNGLFGEVFDLTDKHYDGINHTYEDRHICQARIWINHKRGQSYHTYRHDGISHTDAAFDIVNIKPKPPQTGEGE